MLEQNGHKVHLCAKCDTQQFDFAESLYKYLQHAEKNYSGDFLCFEIGRRLAEEDLIEQGKSRNWYHLLSQTLAYHAFSSNYATFHIDFLGERLQIRLKRKSSIREATRELNSLLIGYVLTLVQTVEHSNFLPKNILINSDVEVGIPAPYSYHSSQGSTSLSINFPASWLIGNTKDKSTASSQSLEKIKQKCRRNLGKSDWNIGELAKECNVSVRALQRTLSSYNTSYRQIVLDEKIAYVRSELAKHNSHGNIAKKIGFTEYSAYSRFFKKMTGSTPKEY